jgi:LysM repeat protein
VGWVYKQYGVDLPRSSRAMMGVGTPITRAELRPGDLVFFNYGYHHVGIYTGDDKYIHSPSRGKRIQESDLNGKGRGDHMVGARRIIDNRGVTAISDSLKAEWVKASRHQTQVALNDKAAKKHTGSAAYAPSSVSAKTASTGGTKSQVSTKTYKNYKVTQGDTIVMIAKKYGVTGSDIVAANGLRNKHKLKIGQILKIPEKKSSSTGTTAKKTQSSKSKSKAAPAKSLGKTANTKTSSQKKS